LAFQHAANEQWFRRQCIDISRPVKPERAAMVTSQCPIQRIARASLADDIEFHVWLQYQFHCQWQALRAHCRQRGVLLFGDLPLYVSHDSVDVWLQPELFLLNPDGMASSVAGVPPDYFAPRGQRWGNPIYRWERHQETGFNWWIDRMRSQTRLFDIVRIDHFRGLEAYWEVPGDAPTAETGQWRPGPGSALLDALHANLPGLRLVAEDLGTITSAVDALRNQYQMPGIRVLQFAFDGHEDNPHAPHNVVPNMVLYTGTHDNDTSLGWFNGLDADARQHVRHVLSEYGDEFPLSLIRCAFASAADTVIVPLQDLLGLDSAARINTPGTTVGNWHWRLPANWPAAAISEILGDLIERYGR
jgi:4-alpha-glucanotransferase